MGIDPSVVWACTCISETCRILLTYAGAREHEHSGDDRSIDKGESSRFRKLDVGSGRQYSHISTTDPSEEYTQDGFVRIPGNSTDQSTTTDSHEDALFTQPMEDLLDLNFDEGFAFDGESQQFPPNSFFAYMGD